MKNADGFSVRCLCEGLTDNVLEIFKMPWLPFFQEIKVVFVVLKNKFDTELHISLSTFHDIKDISKSKFRLDHPKFSNVSACMRNFRSESGPKCVDVRKSTAEVLDCKLT